MRLGRKENLWHLWWKNKSLDQNLKNLMMRHLCWSLRISWRFGNKSICNQNQVEGNFRITNLLQQLLALQGRKLETMQAIPDLQYTRTLHRRITHLSNQKTNLKPNAFILPQYFSAVAVHTMWHIINCVYLRLGTLLTPYEIWKGRKPNLNYFHIFGSKCYILNDCEQREKFEPKNDEGIFLGYCLTCRAYKVYYKRTKTIQESINVVVDDQPQG